MQGDGDVLRGLARSRADTAFVSCAEFVAKVPRLEVAPGGAHLDVAAGRDFITERAGGRKDCAR